MTMGRQFWREPAKQLRRALEMTNKRETPMAKALIERLGHVTGNAVAPYGTEAVTSKPMSMASNAHRARARRKS